MFTESRSRGNVRNKNALLCGETEHLRLADSRAWPAVAVIIRWRYELCAFWGPTRCYKVIYQVPDADTTYQLYPPSDAGVWVYISHFAATGELISWRCSFFLVHAASSKHM